MSCRGLRTRIGSGGRLYYKYTKEPPKPYASFEGPYIRNSGLGLVPAFFSDKGSHPMLLPLPPSMGFSRSMHREYLEGRGT